MTSQHRPADAAKKYPALKSASLAVSALATGLLVGQEVGTLPAGVLGGVYGLGATLGLLSMALNPRK